MAAYYVHTSKDIHGDYEVHESRWHKMPLPHNREYLGEHSTCSSAVDEAEQRGYQPANGCIYCSAECHTS